jgi:hypothetical protein
MNSRLGMNFILSLGTESTGVENLREGGGGKFAAKKESTKCDLEWSVGGGGGGF